MRRIDTLIYGYRIETGDADMWNPLKYLPPEYEAFLERLGDGAARHVDWMFGTPKGLASLTAGSALGVLVAPMAAPVFIGLGVAVNIVGGVLRRQNLRKLNEKERNVFYLGGHKNDGQEVWLTADDVRQHTMIVGDESAEAMLGMAENAMAWSSGLVFCCAQSDKKTVAQIYEMARRYSREDDILVLDFRTGNRDVSLPGNHHVSNTLNPFSTASADSLISLIVSLMDDSGGDGAMWKGRAIAMCTGVMRALIWLRDTGNIALNIGTIRDYLNLKAIIGLADPQLYPEMPAVIRKSIKSYLSSLPGYDEERGYRQMQTTLDQHGYLEMQFTRICGSLSDVYGHIFFTEAAGVDMNDVIQNRRILVVLLPDAKVIASDEVYLGKLIMANLKALLGSTLGGKVQQSWENVVAPRPISNAPPFLVCLDHPEYYAIDGMALMCAQARSLGVGLILASQDIPTMKRINEKETAAIIANTNTKIFMQERDLEADLENTPRMKVMHQDLVLDDISPPTSEFPLGEVSLNDLIALAPYRETGETK